MIIKAGIAIANIAKIMVKVQVDDSASSLKKRGQSIARKIYEKVTALPYMENVRVAAGSDLDALLYDWLGVESVDERYGLLPPGEYPAVAYDLFEAGRIDMNEGYLEEAIKCFEAALKFSTDEIYLPILYFLAVSLFNIGRVDEAVEYLQEIANLSEKNTDENVDSRLLLAAIYHERDDLKEAVRCLRYFLIDYPESPKAILGLYRIYRQIGDFEKAELWFDRACKVAGSNPSLLTILAERSIAGGQPEIGNKFYRLAMIMVLEGD